MKNLTSAQISQVKNLEINLCSTSFHGNKKKVGSLPVPTFIQIVEKKKARQKQKYATKRSVFQIFRSILAQAKENKNTDYFKTLIEGNTGIYLASPEYGHADYNKVRVFEKTPITLKLLQMFRSITSK